MEFCVRDAPGLPKLKCKCAHSFLSTFIFCREKSPDKHHRDRHHDRYSDAPRESRRRTKDHPENSRVSATLKDSKIIFISGSKICTYFGFHWI